MTGAFYCAKPVICVIFLLARVNPSGSALQHADALRAAWVAGWPLYPAVARAQSFAAALLR